MSRCWALACAGISSLAHAMPAGQRHPDPPPPARTPTHACTFRYDIAVIQFGTSIGSTVGYMGLTTNLQNGYLNTAGYPGDKADGTQWFTSRNELDIYPYDKLMYTKLVRPPGCICDSSPCPLWPQTPPPHQLPPIHPPHLLPHAQDIIPGQSGSPTWELRNSGKRYIKGVVSHQSCASSSVSGTYPGQTCSSSLGYNGIVQIEGTHFNNILDWR